VITQNKIIEPSDRPIADLVKHALQAVKSWQQLRQMTPRVLFKHTCGNCGQRGFIDKPETVPNFVRCESCHHFQPYEKGGYSLGFTLEGTSPHGDTADASRKVDFDSPTVRWVKREAPTMSKDIPAKYGCRINPDQSITPLDTDALRQFVATCEAQQKRKEAANATAEN